jgi:hypothetical protein
MLKDIFLRIVQLLFKKDTQTNQKDITKNDLYTAEYEKIDDINFDAIFGRKLSRYIVNDSNFEVEGENARAELLNKTAQSMWKKIKKITAYELGTGGILIVPYVSKGKIFYNLVPQARMTIDKTEGELITGATILAERKEIVGTIKTEVYLRWTNYEISDNGVLTITQQYTDENGKKIPTPDFWKDINEVLSISGVDRVPFGYIKSPQDNRKMDDKYGVPITYGAEHTITEIRQTLKNIADEFEAKKVMLFIDKSAFGKDKKPSSMYYQMLDTGTDDFWQLFDPAIRESSYYARLQEQYARLEIEVGTSEGILTKPTSTYQNVDETRRALFDTSSLIDDARTLIEDGLSDFFIACNVLANAYNLSAQGEYELKFDWSTSYLEDTQDEFNQLTVGLDKGLIKKAELRNWIKSSETMKESEQAVAEIDAENPDIETLLGTKGNNIGQEE